MKNFSIHIKSEDICNIYINGNFAGLIDNIETFTLDLRVYTNKLIITKEPVSKQKKLLLPYTIKLSLNDKPSCDSELVKVVPYKNQEYDIMLKSGEVKSHKKLEKVFDNYIEQYNLVVVNDGLSYINIYENGAIRLTLSTQELNTISAEKHDDIMLIKAITLNNKYFIMAINCQNFEVVYNQEVEKFEQNENEIKTLENINDIAKHGKVFSLYLKQPYTTYSYFVYMNNGVEPIMQPKLIPYAFLEAIKIKNYALAKQYLSEKLLKNTTDEHLDNYFYDLKDIHYNTYNDNENIINYTLFCGDKIKSYDFSVYNAKIDDIEEIELWNNKTNYCKKATNKV